MTVTEVALLHLFTDIAVEDVELRAKLAHAKKIMQDYTGRTFYYFQQIEDPSYVYIVGEWESLEQHLDQFIPGTENQAVLESLKDDVAVDWLLHIDASHAKLPLPRTATEREKALSEQCVWSVTRRVMEDDGRDAFQQTLNTSKSDLYDLVTDDNIGGGWRVDKENNKEESVLFCSWIKASTDANFPGTEGLEKYGQMQAHVDGAEVKHMKLLDI